MSAAASYLSPFLHSSSRSCMLSRSDWPCLRLTVGALRRQSSSSRRSSVCWSLPPSPPPPRMPCESEASRSLSRSRMRTSRFCSRETWRGDSRVVEG